MTNLFQETGARLRCATRWLWPWVSRTARCRWPTSRFVLLRPTARSWRDWRSGTRNLGLSAGLRLLGPLLAANSHDPTAGHSLLGRCGRCVPHINNYLRIWPEANWRRRKNYTSAHVDYSRINTHRLCWIRLFGLVQIQCCNFELKYQANCCNTTFPYGQSWQCVK